MTTMTKTFRAENKWNANKQHKKEQPMTTHQES